MHVIMSTFQIHDQVFRMNLLQRLLTSEMRDVYCTEHHNPGGNLLNEL